MNPNNCGPASIKDKPTVIFDLGNVLVLFDILITCRGFARYSPFSPEVIARKTFGQPVMVDFETGRISGDEFYRLVCCELEIEIDTEVFKEIWSRMFWENTPVTDLLRKLKKDHQLLLLSNTNPWHFESCMENYPALHVLDGTILSYKEGVMKPDSAIYKIALEKARNSPVIYVDDKPEFASAASENGLVGVHFQSPRQLYDDLTRYISWE